MQLLGKSGYVFEEYIPPEKQGTYFTIPFTVEEDVQTIHILYTYSRYRMDDTEQLGLIFHSREEVNIIDIGLIGPDGEQVGASGSDKSEFFVSETEATPGYNPCRIVPGTWQILVGAYKVEPGGVEVSYRVSLIYKQPRWLKGDLHAHTLASDGVHTAEELAWKAKRSGLNFVAITDHNQMVSAVALPRVEGITLIPGMEWTHYQGHANFLGVDKPFDGSFATNTPEEALSRFESARQRGALITINHPFEEGCGFAYDLSTLPFDCLEIWNGPMRESNLKALGLWHSLLVSGKKVPICGGSDYHRDTPFIFLGGPTTCVYAQSAGASDILDALRNGHAYLVFAPNGPTLEMSAGDDAVMGDTVRWMEAKELWLTVNNLLAGDVVRVVTATEAQVVWKAPTNGDFEMEYIMPAPGFARIEVLRAFLPGLPLLPALLSNPIYFEGEKTVE
jgi:hypothetical protein